MNVLKLRDFRTLWFGQTFAQLGDAVYYLVFLFFADRLTGDPRIVALIAALQALPFLIVAPMAGVWADRYDRRLIMVASQGGAGVIMALFGVTIVLLPPEGYVTALIIAAPLVASVNAAFLPARTAAIPSLVPDRLVAEANALAQATQQAMIFVGLGLSAGVLAILAELFSDTAFLVSAIAFNAAALITSGIIVLRLPRLKPDRTQEHISKFWPELMQGLRTVRQDPLLKILFPITAVVTLAISGFMIVYVTVNREWFGGEFRSFALLEIGFIAPLMFMSLYVGRLEIRRPGIPFSIGIGVTGVCIALMAVAQNYWVFFGLNFIAGLAMPFAWIPSAAYMQLAFPEAMRGRVNSVNMMVTVGLQPVGLLLIGPLLEALGLVVVFILMGLGMTLPAVAGILSRDYRTATTPISEIEPATSPQ